MAHLVRQRSLLAYLIMHRDAPQARQQIAFHFWPDASEAQARASLRKALSDLRRVLPKLDHFVQIEDHLVRWRNSTDNSTKTTTDVELFTHHMAEAKDRASGDCRSSAAAGGFLYTGDLLPACYEDWQLREREQLHSMISARHLHPRGSTCCSAREHGSGDAKPS